MEGLASGLSSLASALFSGGGRASQSSGGSGSQEKGLIGDLLTQILPAATLGVVSAIGQKESNKISDRQFQQELQLRQQELQLQRDKLKAELAQVEAGIAATGAQLKQAGIKMALESTLQGARQTSDSIIQGAQLQQAPIAGIGR